MCVHIHVLVLTLLDHGFSVCGRFCSVVEYANYDDMKNAMRKLNGVELNGRKLRLVEDYRGGRRRRYAWVFLCP